MRAVPRNVRYAVSASETRAHYRYSPRCLLEIVRSLTQSPNPAKRQLTQMPHQKSCEDDVGGNWRLRLVPKVSTFAKAKAPLSTPIRGFLAAEIDACRLSKG